LHALDEVFGSPRWRNNSVGHCFAQFILSGAGILRDREVLGESVRTIDCHGAGNPDQLASFDVKDFCEVVIQNMVAVLHIGSSCKKSITRYIYNRLSAFRMPG
jgi:hypothetical protein